MSPRHGPGSEEIDAVARRVRSGFDQLPDEAKREVRDLVLSVFRSFEAEGWDMLSRDEKSTFEMAQWMFLRVDANIVAATPKAVILLSLHAAIISVAVLGGDRIVQELDATLRPVVGTLSSPCSSRLSRRSGSSSRRSFRARRATPTAIPCCTSGPSPAWRARRS